MDFSYLLEPYDALVQKADDAFHRISEEFGTCVRCEPHCADCCHAVFGLFLIEAVFLKQDFDKLGEMEKAAAIKKAGEAKQEFDVLERTLKEFEGDPRMTAYSMARARIRCPLLSDHNECILYPFRPITCRVYGIPTLVRGTAKVCGLSAFKKEQSYPTFNLDGAQRELHELSRLLLERVGEKDPSKAAVLLSVAKVLKTPLEELITGYSEGIGTKNGHDL